MVAKRLRAGRSLPVIERPLSLHERFAHLPVITRDAHTVTYLFRYPFNKLPTTDHLDQRVRQVQEKVEHLWAEIMDGETNHPRMRLRDGPWPPTDIVRDDTYSLRTLAGGDGSGGKEGEGTSEIEVESRLLEQEIARMKERASTGEAAWQVTRYLPASVAPASGAGHTAVGDKGVVQGTKEVVLAPGVYGAAAGSIYTDPDYTVSMSRHEGRSSGSTDDSDDLHRRYSSPFSAVTSVSLGLVQHTTSPCFIAVSAYHHLLDGTAGLALANALLSPAGSSADLSAYPGIAPRMEDLLDIRPPLLYAALEAFHELAVPALPRVIREKIERKACWPDRNVMGLPPHFPEAQLSLHLPARWIAQLKAIGKARGVSTLHPVLQTAFSLAMWEAMDRPHEPITVLAPHNCRQQAKKKEADLFPPAGGIFVSTFHKVYDFHLELGRTQQGSRDRCPASPSEELNGEEVGFGQKLRKLFKTHKGGPKAAKSPTATSACSTSFTEPQITAEMFWMLARELSAALSTRSQIKDAEYRIGMMEHIPSSSSFTSPHADNPKRRTITGWEDFFWRGLESGAPFRETISFSNLGRTDLPPGCEGMRWTESAVPFGEVMLVSLIGHGGGLEVTVAFRDGCAVGREDVRRVLAGFEGKLAELVAEVSSVSKSG